MILLLLSCSTDPTDNADTTISTGVPDLPEIERPASQAQWTVADVEVAFTEALVDGFPDANHIQAVYLDLLSYGDAKCPGNDTYIDATWLYGCTAESGYWFSGVSEYFTKSTDSFEFESIIGDLQFLDPDGQAFSGGGHLNSVLGSNNDQTGAFTEISGSWLWEGEPEKSWLADNGISGALIVFTGITETTETIALSGAISFNGLSLDFEDLRLIGSCDWQAAGVMSIRDPSGSWHRLDFGEGCSACAQGTWGDDSTGEICPDFSPILDTFQPYLKEL